MSSQLGNEFGAEHGGSYGTVVKEWTERLEGVDELNDGLRNEWADDLSKALGAPIEGGVASKSASTWSKVAALPSGDTLKRFAQIATKAALRKDMFDLLRRLHGAVRKAREIRDAVLKAQALAEFLSRFSQTVAQIYDMVQDKFNNIMGRFYKNRQDLTGRRRWRTADPSTSRHRRLEGKVREEGNTYRFKGEDVEGPRPPGGSPDNWSNCSCFLEFEKNDGDWVRLEQ